VKNADRLLTQIATEHDGVIAVPQALALGLRRHQLDHRVRTGQLTRWRTGVLTHPVMPVTPRQVLRCAVLATGGAASHRSATWLHGLTDRPPPLPEVSVPAPVRFRDQRVLVHRQLDWNPFEVVAVDGIPTTDVVRTVVDIGTKVSRRQLQAIVEIGIARDLFSYQDLVERRREHARRGRDGVGPLRELLEYWEPDLAGVDSPLEVLLWQVIEDFGLPRPKRQYEVEVDGRHFRLDLAYPEQMIAIEGDGYGPHSHRAAHENDRLRQNLLTLRGWVFLRFTWRQIVDSPTMVASSIRRLHAARSAR